jgi:hypothetical protein
MTENNDTPDRPYALDEAPSNEELGPLVTEPEAPAYLGVEKREFDQLVEQYGIARRYRTEPAPAWYYVAADLDEIREAIASSR